MSVDELIKQLPRDIVKYTIAPFVAVKPVVLVDVVKEYQTYSRHPLDPDELSFQFIWEGKGEGTLNEQYKTWHRSVVRTDVSCAYMKKECCRHEICITIDGMVDMLRYDRGSNWIHRWVFDFSKEWTAGEHDRSLSL